MKIDLDENLGDIQDFADNLEFDNHNHENHETDGFCWENTKIDFDDTLFDVDYGDDGEYEDVDELDLTFQTQDEKSDNAYQKTTDKIVEISRNQLKNQYDSKIELQKNLSRFFSVFLSFQFGALVIFMVMKGFIKDFKLSDSIILAYMTSVFVESLGAIIIMIKFAFNSEQETEILHILNSVISKFKIYNSYEHGKNNHKK